jgi:hypothetical protein
MPAHIILAVASNTFAPALATLRRLGYAVSPTRDGYRADSATRHLLADDLLQLLGLVMLLDVRGDSWQPTAEEVQAVIDLDCGQQSTE